MTVHLQVPMTLARNGSLATVAQDGPDDITQSVRVLLLTEPNTRLTDPEWGINMLFARDLTGIAEEVRRLEPRADQVDVEAAITSAGLAEVTVRTGSSG